MEQFYTIVFIRQDDNILLGYKKRGLFSHLYNGFGGKLELGETPFAAAVRELEEECGLTTNRLISNGTLVVDLPSQHAEIYLYTAYEFTGEIRESQEMRPEWFNIMEIPYRHMRPDFIYWLPLVLAGAKVNAYVKYGDNEIITQKFVNVI